MTWSLFLVGIDVIRLKTEICEIMKSSKRKKEIEFDTTHAYQLSLFAQQLPNDGRAYSGCWSVKRTELKRQLTCGEDPDGELKLKEVLSVRRSSMNQLVFRRPRT